MAILGKGAQTLKPRMSNKRNFHEQCVRFMDRVEKMHLFGLYSTLKSHGLSLLNEMVLETSDMADHYPEQAWLSSVLPDEQRIGTSQTQTNLETSFNTFTSFW